jgi:hypothetical protein
MSIRARRPGTFVARRAHPAGLAADDAEVLFIGGTSRNQANFYPLGTRTRRARAVQTCNLAGKMATTAPVLSRPNAFGTYSPIVFEGVLTQTVEDAELGVTALAGYDSGDPFSLDQRSDLIGALRRSVKGLRSL